MWLNGLNFVIVIHHFAKFSGHRPRGSSDAADKIFYITLQDHAIKGFGYFMKGNFSLYISTMSKLIALDIVLIDI